MTLTLSCFVRELCLQPSGMVGEGEEGGREAENEKGREAERERGREAKEGERGEREEV